MAHALPSAGSAWHQGALDTDSGVFSPVFLLPPQSLLTGEIMDGTRFWGLAQVSELGCAAEKALGSFMQPFWFVFSFFQAKGGGDDFCLGFFSVVFTNLWHWCSWCIHCHNELVTRKIFLELCYSGTHSALADVSLQGCD